MMPFAPNNELSSSRSKCEIFCVKAVCNTSSSREAQTRATDLSSPELTELMNSPTLLLSNRLRDSSRNALILADVATVRYFRNKLGLQLNRRGGRTVGTCLAASLAGADYEGQSPACQRGRQRVQGLAALSQSPGRLGLVLGREPA